MQVLKVQIHHREHKAVHKSTKIIPRLLQIHPRDSKTFQNPPPRPSEISNCFAYSVRIASEAPNLPYIVYRLHMRFYKRQRPLQNHMCNPYTINGRIGTPGSDHPYIAYGFKKSKSVRYIWMMRAEAPYSSMYSARIAIVVLEGLV